MEFRKSLDESKDFPLTAYRPIYLSANLLYLGESKVCSRMSDVRV